MLLVFAGCSEKSTKPPPEPPVEPVYILDGWPSWSPDGRYIYYKRDSRGLADMERYGHSSIWAYDTQTGHHGYLVGPGMFPKSNPEGTILAFDWGWNLFFYYFDSRTVRQVTHGFNAITFNWSPSGNSLIVSPGEGILIDTLGNIYARLIPWDRSNGGWRGGWDGQWISENRIMIVSDCLSSDSLRRAGILIVDTLGQIIDTVVIDDSPRAHLGGYDYPAMSPDQSMILTNYTFVLPDGQSSGDFRIFTRQGVLLNLIPGGGGIGRWSPDGSKIIYQRYTWMGDNPNPFDPDYSRITLWLCNADGSDPHELIPWPQPDPDTAMFDGGYNWVTNTYNP